MITKIVYVVVSNQNDWYYEQAILSMYSAKLYNPDSEIILVIDDKTDIYIKNHPFRIETIVSDMVMISLPSQYNNMQRSRILKTNLRQYIRGDYVFIDTDTIITDKLEAIDNLDCSIAAVIDKHVVLSEHGYKNDIIKYSKKFNWKVDSNFRYFNSGIMYVKDNQISKEFYQKWAENWHKGKELYGIMIDQPSLAKTNEDMGYLIKELSGEWNCQVCENGLKYLYSAKIIHYFASTIGSKSTRVDPYILKNNRVYGAIRNQGITKEIEESICHAKECFYHKTFLVSGDICDLLQTPLFGIARRVNNKFPWINKLIRFFKK